MNTKAQIPESELILNADNSVYHLNLKAEDIADTIILVGDKDRVPLISSFFDSIEITKQKREFVTHTGFYKNKRISVLSTGIGTDNIDIVLNELDALVNIDLEKRTIKEKSKSLNFIRIGTCGAIHEEIPINSFIVSHYGLGFDNLLKFYKCSYRKDEKEIYDKLKVFLKQKNTELPFYLFAASEKMKKYFSDKYFKGITITAPGFFGPQGRSVRTELTYPKLIDALSEFEHKGNKILNFEMETSAIFGLSRILGHNAITVDLVLANRITKQASANYNHKMKDLAVQVLDIISK
ncbi:MAG: nucleoside phosphorylase, partial [Bacteroidota bacterium]|nr:nucleoside phosphorylase [Bacteroidota bacterium]